MSGATVDISGLPTAVHHMPSVIAKPKLYVPQPNSVAANGAIVSRGELNGSLYTVRSGEHWAEFVQVVDYLCSAVFMVPFLDSFLPIRAMLPV